MKRNTLGFSSNEEQITFNDCDGNPNNYFTFFSNLNNVTTCEVGSWPMSGKFLNTFNNTKYSAIMEHNDFWFAMELHFGGCGMRYSGACSSIDGYAVGLPFGK